MNSTAKRTKWKCSPFTPGPWSLEKRLSTEISIRAADKTVIAGARCDSYLPGYESCANARLIAAAPELLAALKALLGIDNPPGAEIGHIDYAQAVNQARAALARAEEGE